MFDDLIVQCSRKQVRNIHRHLVNLG
jgi:hypothetical protein